jgi:hypothetical protein
MFLMRDVTDRMTNNTIPTIELGAGEVAAGQVETRQVQVAQITARQVRSLHHVSEQDMTSGYRHTLEASTLQASIGELGANKRRSMQIHTRKVAFTVMNDH